MRHGRWDLLDLVDYSEVRRDHLKKGTLGMGISLSTFSPISRPLWVHCQLSAARYYQVLSVEATWVWRWTTWSIAGLRANFKVTSGDIIPNSFFWIVSEIPLVSAFCSTVQCSISTLTKFISTQPVLYVSCSVRQQCSITFRHAGAYVCVTWHFSEPKPCGVGFWPSRWDRNFRVEATAGWEFVW